MIECVLDASVVLAWFGSERDLPSLGLRAQFEAGELSVVAPPLLPLEVLNVAGRRWGWAPEALDALARTLTELPFELVEPELAGVGAWVARGLTAYDAAYVVVAESAGISLFTLDAAIAEVAGGVASPPPSP